jgi:hypothetical protein
MKIETKFNVGDIVYYLVDKQNIKKGKIESSEILIKDEGTVCIRYSVHGSGILHYQNDLFKDFEDFKNTFWLRFEGANK